VQARADRIGNPQQKKQKSHEYGLPTLPESIVRSLSRTSTDPIRSKIEKKKNSTCPPVAPGRRPSGGGGLHPRPGAGRAGPWRCSGRHNAEAVWPLAPDRPKFVGPFCFSKKKSKKGRVLYTRRTYIKKETNYFVRFASPSRCRAFPESYISAATRFFVDFSSATACYLCVHIASFLHDFDRFSYNLSTASC
jgi:hypothetical protein